MFLCLVALTFELDPKISGFPGLTVELYCVKFGDPAEKTDKHR